jgi:hypothetical protein
MVGLAIFLGQDSTKSVSLEIQKKNKEEEDDERWKIVCVLPEAVASQFSIESTYAHDMHSQRVSQEIESICSPGSLHSNHFPPIYLGQFRAAKDEAT